MSAVISTRAYPVINMLSRDLKKATAGKVDLVVIGGGIFGACAAWEASLRGLKVVLVERQDFGAGTSANSFKMVHGGIRYLQHFDLPRVRSSCHERSAFLRIAPHLVQPLPIVMPTYGFGTKGKPFLAAGLRAYDAITMDRNRGIDDPERKIPSSRTMSREELLGLFPGLNTPSLTGAAIFHDAQMYNPTRLVLAFIQSAAGRGAVALNYTSAHKIRVEQGRVRGCVVKDVLTGDLHDIRCDNVLNAAGPWAERILSENGMPPSGNAPPAYSRDSCFVIRRRFTSDFALAVSGASADSDAIVSRDGRHLFLVPWRDYTLVGVWHKVWSESPDAVSYDRDDLSEHIAEINHAYPALKLTEEDVLMWNAGLLPFGDPQEDSGSLSFGKRSSLIDHYEEHGIKGLVTLIGIRYTMGRADAARAVDMLFGKSSRSRKSGSDWMPVYGGDFGHFRELAASVHRELGGALEARIAEVLAHNHGSNCGAVLELGRSIDRGLDLVPGTSTLRAEVENAVQNEMAVSLSDVIFRRTDIGTGGNPGKEAIEVCAEIAAARLNWDNIRRKQEIDDVLRRFPDKLGDRKHCVGQPQTQGAGR